MITLSFNASQFQGSQATLKASDIGKFQVKKLQFYPSSTPVFLKPGDRIQTLELSMDDHNKGAVPLNIYYINGQLAVSAVKLRFLKSNFGTSFVDDLANIGEVIATHDEDTITLYPRQVHRNRILEFLK